MATTSIGSLPDSSQYSSPITTTGPSTSTLLKAANPESVKTSVDSSSQGSVITSLGSNRNSSPQVYTAQGLLNSASKGGGTAPAISSSSASANTITQLGSQRPADQEIIQSVASSSETSGIYTSAGGLKSTESTENSSQLATA